MPKYTVTTSDGKIHHMDWNRPGKPTQADVDRFLEKKNAVGLYRNAIPEPPPPPPRSYPSKFLLETSEEQTADLMGRAEGLLPRFATTRLPAFMLPPPDTDYTPRIPPPNKPVPKRKPQSGKKPTPRPEFVSPEYTLSDDERRAAMDQRAKSRISYRDSATAAFAPRQPLTGSLLNPADAAAAGRAFWQDQFRRIRLARQLGLTADEIPGDKDALNTLSYYGILDRMLSGEATESDARDILTGNRAPYSMGGGLVHYVPGKGYLSEQDMEALRRQWLDQDFAKRDTERGLIQGTHSLIYDVVSFIGAEDPFSGFRRAKPGEDPGSGIRWPSAEEQAAMGRAGAEGAPSAVTSMIIARVAQRLPPKLRWLAIPAVILASREVRKAQTDYQRRTMGEEGFAAHQRQLAADRAKYPKSTYFMESAPNLMSLPGNPLSRAGLAAGGIGGLSSAASQGLDYLEAPAGQKPDFNLPDVFRNTAESAVFHGADTPAGRAFYKPIDYVLNSVTSHPTIARGLYHLDPEGYISEHPSFDPTRIVPDEYRAAGGLTYPETVTPRVLRRVVRDGQVSYEPVRVENRRTAAPTKPPRYLYTPVRSREELKEALKDPSGFHYDTETAENSATFWEALARSWAERNGRQVADWYNRYAGGILNGGEELARTLIHQEGGDPADAADTAGATIPMRNWSKNPLDVRQIIAALSSPNKSTFIHETGHVFLRQLLDEAGYNAQVKQDMAVLESWAGASPEGWTRQHHEKFARGFERWLQSGEAPNPSLAGVFARFKDWLTDVYSRVVQTVGGKSALEQHPAFTPEVIDVLSRYVGDVSVPAKTAVQADSPAPLVGGAVPDARPGWHGMGGVSEILPPRGGGGPSPYGMESGGGPNGLPPSLLGEPSSLEDVLFQQNGPIRSLIQAHEQQRQTWYDSQNRHVPASPQQRLIATDPLKPSLDAFQFLTPDVEPLWRAIQKYGWEVQLAPYSRTAITDYVPIDPNYSRWQVVPGQKDRRILRAGVGGAYTNNGYGVVATASDRGAVTKIHNNAVNNNARILSIVALSKENSLGEIEPARIALTELKSFMDRQPDANVRTDIDDLAQTVAQEMNLPGINSLDDALTDLEQSLGGTIPTILGSQDKRRQFVLRMMTGGAARHAGVDPDILEYVLEHTTDNRNVKFGDIIGLTLLDPTQPHGPASLFNVPELETYNTYYPGLGLGLTNPVSALPLYNSGYPQQQLRTRWGLMGKVRNEQIHIPIVNKQLLHNLARQNHGNTNTGQPGTAGGPTTGGGTTGTTPPNGGGTTTAQGGVPASSAGGMGGGGGGHSYGQRPDRIADLWDDSWGETGRNPSPTGEITGPNTTDLLFGRGIELLNNEALSDWERSFALDPDTVAPHILKKRIADLQDRYGEDRLTPIQRALLAAQRLKEQERILRIDALRNRLRARMLEQQQSHWGQ